MSSNEDEDPYVQIAKLHSANLQAAQYGLALIDEKKLLESQHKDLQNEHDALKIQFEQLKTQLKTIQANKREETLQGETNEEVLLHEKQTREDFLLREINRNEHELRTFKHENERLQSENEKMHQNLQDLSERIRDLDEAKLKLKYDLKESKSQEQRLFDVNTELEADNVALQEQVQKLRENLIDFDSLKHENEQLQDKIDDLHRTMEELKSLKSIAESQLTDLHNSLRDEREQKHIYKQQLDHRIQEESRRNLDTLRMTLNGHKDETFLLGVSVGDEEDEIDDNDDDTSRVPTNEILENDQNEQQPMGNLFSEVHGNEIRKLEVECLQLAQIKTSLDGQLLILNEKCKILAHKIQHLLDIVQTNRSIESNLSDDTNLLLNVSLESIEQLETIVNKHVHLFNGDSDLWKKKSEEQDISLIKLKQDNHILIKQINDSQTLFNKNHENLLNFAEDLENLSQQISKTFQISISSGDWETRKQQIVNSSKKLIDPNVQQQLLDLVQDQFKRLKSSIEQISPSMNHNKENVQTVPNNSTNELSNDTKELQDQIIKLRSLLTTKREQIGTLRTVLKANKQTAEVALANLKSKYENEKLIVTETMSKLRNELKSLKEDAATFASLRAMFAARCDEYVTQLDELQRQVHAAEEEKKTLNSLLRMAIEQKLALTQKLEDIEMDNERVNTKRSSLTSTTILPSPMSSTGLPLGLLTPTSASNVNSSNTNFSNPLPSPSTAPAAIGVGSSQEPRRGRFIPPRMMQALASNRNQQLSNKR